MRRTLIHILGLAVFLGLVACSQIQEPESDQSGDGVLVHLNKFELNEGVTVDIAESVLEALPYDVVSVANRGAISIVGKSISVAVQFEHGLATCYKINLDTSEYFVIGYIADGIGIPPNDSPSEYGLSESAKREIELVQGMNETERRSEIVGKFLSDLDVPRSAKFAWPHGRIFLAPGLSSVVRVPLLLHKIGEPWDQNSASLRIDDDGIMFCDTNDPNEIVIQGIHDYSFRFYFDIPQSGGLVASISSGRVVGYPYVDGDLWSGVIGQSQFFDHTLENIPVASPELSGDLRVDLADFGMFGLEFGKNPAYSGCDYDGDGAVDLSDFSTYGIYHGVNCN